MEEQRHPVTDHLELVHGYKGVILMAQGNEGTITC